MKNFKLINTNNDREISLTIDGVEQKNNGCIATIERGFKTAVVYQTNDGMIYCKFSKSETPSTKISKLEATVKRVIGIAAFETETTEIDEVMVEKSFTPFAGCDETQIAIRTTFSDRGINGVRAFYAKRNELNEDARNTVINIFETVAFNGSDADAELAMETIEKY